MPLDAWILLVLSIGLGLGLELAFMRARRGGGYVAEESTRHEEARRAKHLARRVTRDEP
jgi:uncharacterized protein YqjF (DUF2071 family)